MGAEQHMYNASRQFFGSPESVQTIIAQKHWKPRQKAIFELKTLSPNFLVSLPEFSRNFLAKEEENQQFADNHKSIEAKSEIFVKMNLKLKKSFEALKGFI